MKSRYPGAAESENANLEDLGSLLREIRDQSSDQAGKLLEQFRPYLLTIAQGELPERLRGKAGASDLVQETMLRGVESFADFRGSSREELAGWLRQILLNHLTNVTVAFATAKRDVGREVPVDSRIVHPVQESPSAQTLSNEDWDRLRRALERLPEDYRQAVLLRHRQNLSFVDIGRLLNRSEEAARKLWGRAIQQLQRELGSDASRS